MFYIGGIHYYTPEPDLRSLTHLQLYNTSVVPDQYSCSRMCGLMTQATELDKTNPLCKGLVYLADTTPNCVIFVELRGVRTYSPKTSFAGFIEAAAREQPKYYFWRVESPSIRLCHGVIQAMVVYGLSTIFTAWSFILLLIFDGLILPVLGSPHPAPYTDFELAVWFILAVGSILVNFHFVDGPVDPSDKSFTTAFESLVHACLRVLGWEAIFMLALILHKMMCSFPVWGESHKQEPQEGHKDGSLQRTGDKAGLHEGEVGVDAVLVEKEDVKVERSDHA